MDQVHQKQSICGESILNRLEFASKQLDYGVLAESAE